MQVTREAIVAEALSWLGTPYRHMQQCKGAGVDCATFLEAVYSASGVCPHEPIPFYPIDWHMHQNEPRYLNGLLKHAYFIDPRETPPLPGDAMILKTLMSRVENHGAIILTWPEIIHCVPDRGVIRDLESVFHTPYNILRWNGFRG